jgi:hypothetical protein
MKCGRRKLRMGTPSKVMPASTKAASSRAA